MQLRYTSTSYPHPLTVFVPDEIDRDTADEIASESDVTDTTEELWVGRWLGGFVSDSAAVLSFWLPEGWYAKVADND